jgi:acetyl-CoA synthetase
MLENTSFERLSNGEIFHPSPDFLSKLDKSEWEAKSNLAQKDMLSFWAERAGELEWYKPWTKVLDDSNKPFYKWFVEGKVNIVHNCLDRYAMTWRRNKLALIWEGETGEQRAFSYHSLNREVCKFASVIKAMGIIKGDRVTIYLPRIPEIIIAMLACAKIGAIHSVVYGGFSVESLHGRILDSHS